MEKFTSLTAIAAPLRQPNVDTDVIIRIERMFEFDRHSLGPYAFEALRYRSDGTPNPDFLLNQAPFDRAEILIVGANFGCGSSRESAVWALKGLGIRCIIGPSFGDIFFSNCFQNGILPVVLPEQDIDAIVAACAGDPDRLRPTVDLVAQEITSPDGGRYPFAIDPLRREGLLAGLDAIGLTMRRHSEIVRFQQKDRLERPWVWIAPASVPISGAPT